MLLLLFYIISFANNNTGSPLSLLSGSEFSTLFSSEQAITKSAKLMCGFFQHLLDIFRDQILFSVQRLAFSVLNHSVDTCTLYIRCSSVRLYLLAHESFQRRDERKQRRKEQQHLFSLFFQRTATMSCVVNVRASMRILADFVSHTCVCASNITVAITVTYTNTFTHTSTEHIYKSAPRNVQKALRHVYVEYVAQ